MRDNHNLDHLASRDVTGHVTFDSP